jgi:hypothetical protein
VPPSVATVARSACPDTLGQSAVIDPAATLYYAVVPSDPADAGNGVFCGRLEAVNDGWVGIGFSPDGLMAGSQAVVGVPEEGTVLKYDLTTTATPMDGARQTLTGTSIAVVDGLVIMRFEKLLVEDGEVPILEDAVNRFIHARGPPGALGYHGPEGRISFDVIPTARRL